jgi:hypothetical protein
VPARTELADRMFVLKVGTSLWDRSERRLHLCQGGFAEELGLPQQHRVRPHGGLAGLPDPQRHAPARGQRALARAQPGARAREIRPATDRPQQLANVTAPSAQPRTLIDSE